VVVVLYTVKGEELNYTSKTPWMQRKKDCGKLTSLCINERGRCSVRWNPKQLKEKKVKRRYKILNK